MRIRVLAMAGGLLLSACAEQPAIYGAHSYYCCDETFGTRWWHAGQTITLHFDELKQAISQGSKPAGVRTISAAPVFANDKTVERPGSQLYLPADLPPGFYNVASQTAEAGYSWGGSGIIKVIPPDEP